MENNAGTPTVLRIVTSSDGGKTFAPGCKAMATSIGVLPSEKSLYACVDRDIFSACSFQASFSSFALFIIAPISCPSMYL